MCDCAGDVEAVIPSLFEMCAYALCDGRPSPFQMYVMLSGYVHWGNTMQRLPDEVIRRVAALYKLRPTIDAKCCSIHIEVSVFKRKRINGTDVDVSHHRKRFHIQAPDPEVKRQLGVQLYRLPPNHVFHVDRTDALVLTFPENK